MSNIAFVGFMGTGKTAVSKKIANILNLEYVNMDSLIEADQKKSINQIFSKEGEQCFRNIEKRIVKEISQKDNLIIDCGGGVVLNEENIDNLKRNGIIICLRACEDVILKRTTLTGHRPLLNVENPKEKISQLLKFREPFYEKADFFIDTSNISINEVVKQAVDIIKNHPKK